MRMTIKTNFRTIRYLVSTVINLAGVYPRYCNLCNYKGYFRAFGAPLRFDAQCPRCESLERHRLFGLWLEKNESRISGRRILHFAPENIIASRLKPIAGTYTGADINPESVDVALDIEDIALPDSSVDVIVCSHVLEHVNHERALSEIKRVLVPGGIALLMFPIIEGWDVSYRNSSVRTRKERELHFGQWDHIQFFGRDIRDSIMAAGLLLEEFTAVEPYVSKNGLTRGEKLFIAQRPL